MSIKLNKYLNEEHIEAFEKVGVDKLTQGVNIELNQKIYNVKVIETTIPNRKSSGSLDNLVCRIHSDFVFAGESFWTPTKPSKQESAADTGISEKAPQILDLLANGTVLGDEMAPTLARNLSAKEERTVRQYPDLAPKLRTQGTFTNFYAQGTIDRLNELGQENLTQGVNLVHEGITYNVKMIATQTEEGNHPILIFRAYTTDSLLIYTKSVKNYGASTKNIKEEVVGNKISLFHMIHDGAVIDEDVETPVFTGTLSTKATEVFKRHPELATDQPPAYSRKQTAFAFLVSVLALTTVGYGIHKVRKGDITFPTRKEIADFLSKTKANASEYLSQLRQKKPQEGVKA